ncbi:helix-turn-helix domain-containing protein [Ihubacter sp. rT4E-8]|uniref:helix-turn-helix domain-containing protein n=1 Tax=unclassified Ihubacter TaxID=2633299 RepID=UPI003C7E8475
MDTYITARSIKRLREEKRITQSELAEKLGVSSKAVSKWETARGLPDISLIEPLAKALGVSVIELMNGDYRINENVACNLKKSKFYVCPVCGNVMHTTGAAVVSCCGITLPEAEPEEGDECHKLTVSYTDSRHYVSLSHPMTKEHYISFIAYVTDGHFEMKKLYPEGNAEADFLGRGHGLIIAYCNQHGLYQSRV